MINGTIPVLKKRNKRSFKRLNGFFWLLNETGKRNANKRFKRKRFNRLINGTVLPYYINTYICISKSGMDGVSFAVFSSKFGHLFFFVFCFPENKRSRNVRFMCIRIGRQALVIFLKETLKRRCIFYCCETKPKKILHQGVQVGQHQKCQSVPDCRV